MFRFALRSAFALTLFASAALVGGCDSDGNDDGFDMAVYAGTFTGTLTRTTRVEDRTSTVQTAPIVVTVRDDASTGRATVTLDEGPAYAGAPNPEPVVWLGTYDDSGATLLRENGRNTVTYRLHQLGRITGSGVNLYDGLVLDVIAQGRATANSFALFQEGAVTRGDDTRPAGSTIRTDIATTR